MNDKNITPNDKDYTAGYALLSAMAIVVLLIGLTIEYSIRGTIGFLAETKTEEPEPEPEIISETTDGYSYEFYNFKPQEIDQDVYVLAGKASGEIKIKINNENVDVNEDNRFEKKVELIVGDNFIRAEVLLGEEVIFDDEIIIKRREKEEEKGEPEKQVKVSEPPKEEKPIVVITPEPEDKDKEHENIEPEPLIEETVMTVPSEPTIPPNVEEPQPPTSAEPSPVPPVQESLHLSCTVQNTYPFAGESVSITCRIINQNEEPVSGANGVVSISWSSGAEAYLLSTSNQVGMMTTSFTVPSVAQGEALGTVEVEKSGLVLQSSFSIVIQ